MIERKLDWDRPRHTVEQLEDEQAKQTSDRNEIEPTSEQVDDEGRDEKTARQRG